MKTTLIAALLLSAASAAGAQTNAKGSVVERDADVAKEEPGTHGGGGMSTGYSFFDKTPGMKFVFRKRALHPGAGVGPHEQHEDEVYYVLSGKGVMTVDDTKVDMTPGTAVLTRPGSSHSLKQAGNDDLVVLISYEIK